MPIAPAVLTWARERAGYSLDAAAESFPRIDRWEAGESFPSYPQLESLADKFKIPVAVFFFPEPPDLPPVEESFRTLEPTNIAEIPPRIRLLLRKAQSFQMALKSYMTAATLHSVRSLGTLVSGEIAPLSGTLLR